MGVRNRVVRRCAWVRAALALAAGVLSVRTAHAANWINGAGGIFQIGTNWDTGVVPGSTDTVFFDLNDPGYTVTLSGNVTNSGLQVRDDTVSLSIPAAVTYTVINTAVVGNLSGDT